MMYKNLFNVPNLKVHLLKFKIEIDLHLFELYGSIIKQSTLKGYIEIKFSKDQWIPDMALGCS